MMEDLGKVRIILWKDKVLWRDDGREYAVVESIPSGPMSYRALKIGSLDEVSRFVRSRMATDEFEFGDVARR